MSGTPQSEAVEVANQTIALGRELLNLLGQANALATKYNDTGASNVWGALATAAKASDGSLGTADGSPTSGHPIDTRVTTSLNQTTSAANLMSAVGIIQDFQTFMNGSGSLPQVNRRQALAQNLNG